MIQEPATTVPLTAMQKTRLMLDCIPVVFFVLVTIFAWQYIPFIRESSSASLLLLFLGLVILVMGYQAFQRIRDLVSGVAQVQADVLTRTRRSGRRSRGGFYGEFEQLGKLRLRAGTRAQAHDGQRYRVTYSPASKIVWSMEALDVT